MRAAEDDAESLKREVAAEDRKKILQKRVAKGDGWKERERALKEEQVRNTGATRFCRPLSTIKNIYPIDWCNS